MGSRNFRDERSLETETLKISRTSKSLKLNFSIFMVFKIFLETETLELSGNSKSLKLDIWIFM